MTDAMAQEKKTASEWFRTLRDEIVTAFEALEDRLDAPIAAASDDDLLVGGGGGFATAVAKLWFLAPWKPVLA